MMELEERYEFRRVSPGEADEAAVIEAICFPPSEACPLPIMRERAEWVPDAFLVAMERESGKMVGFISALYSNERTLRDEMFTDTRLNDPTGKHVFICSVAVHPAYQRQGIARKMMEVYLKWQMKQGRELAILTCVPEKIQMYQKFGFTDGGESESTWGGEKWNEMWCELNVLK